MEIKFRSSVTLTSCVDHCAISESSVLLHKGVPLAIILSQMNPAQAFASHLFKPFYYSTIFTWLFLVVSFLRVSPLHVLPPKPCMYFSSSPLWATCPTKFILLDLIIQKNKLKQYRQHMWDPVDIVKFCNHDM